MEDTLSFEECLMVAARTPELVAEFDRLAGTQLSKIGRRAPIDAMVDESTGWEKEQLRRFVAFVYECIYSRLPSAGE